MILYRLKSERVRALIEGQRLKRYWVAEVTGVHKTTLRRWLSGGIDGVRAENVRRLAVVLSTTDAEIATPRPLPRKCSPSRDPPCRD